MRAITILLLALLLVPQLVQAKDYVIGEGDGLAISVWGEDKLQVNSRVRPDGKISVPGVGEIMAAGKTPAELQVILADKVKGLVKYDPIVTVAVPDIMNNKAYVFGGGVAPGAFDLKQRTTLLQLLCAINDIRSADLRNAYVLRNGAKIKADFYKLLIKGDTSEDLLIEANDSIFVPPFSERSIYVLGAVATPKYIPYRDDMTVMEAILEAGGFTKFASENQTVIVRREGDKKIEIPVKAKDLIRNGNISQNTPLQVGDYVIAHEGVF